MLIDVTARQSTSTESYSWVAYLSRRTWRGGRPLSEALTKFSVFSHNLKLVNLGQDEQGYGNIVGVGREPNRQPLCTAEAAIANEVCSDHPDRFVRKPPEPPARPRAVWINPPPATTTATVDARQ